MRNSKKLTNEELQYIKDNYHDKGALPIAQHFGVKPDRIRYAANQILGLKISKELALKMSSVAATNKPFEKYAVHPEQFFNIQTPEIAYILGLLWADGHVEARKSKRGYTYYRVTLSTTDPDIFTFLPIFQKTGKWNVHLRRDINPDHRAGYSVCTTNKPLTEFLLDNDYGSKSWKSADRILSKIPDHLKHHWFRGLIDGDGMITENGGVAIYSGKNQDWTYIKNLCQKLNIQYRVITRERELGWSGEFLITKKRGSHKFLEYVYQDTEINKLYLDRKYQKYFKTKSRN